MKFRAILIIGLVAMLSNNTSAQEQPSPVILKKQFIGPTKYIQGDSKMNFRELTVVLKHNAIAYSLILKKKPETGLEELKVLLLLLLLHF